MSGMGGPTGSIRYRRKGAPSGLIIANDYEAMTRYVYVYA